MLFGVVGQSCWQIPQPMQGLTVAENMRVAQRFGGGEVDNESSAEILALVGLDTIADRDAATGLSLTEMKALEIAKALATRPRTSLGDIQPQRHRAAQVDVLDR